MEKVYKNEERNGRYIPRCLTNAHKRAPIHYNVPHNGQLIPHYRLVTERITTDDRRTDGRTNERTRRH